MGNGKENKIQSAISGSLEVYCKNQNLQLFPPYANQQGDGKRKYCADILGMLDGADLIALEIKELDVDTCTLHAFDSLQHKNAMEFEKLNVPLAYAYNSVKSLPYHKRPKPANWEIETLNSVKRSAPKALPGATPSMNKHQSLLDWLNGAHGSNAVELLGRLHGALESVDDLRNGVLVFLYSVQQSTLAILEPTEILEIVHVLKESKSSLSHKEFNLLQRLLAAEADVLKRFLPQEPDNDNAVKKQHTSTPRVRKL